MQKTTPPYRIPKIIALCLWSLSTLSASPPIESTPNEKGIFQIKTASSDLCYGSFVTWFDTEMKEHHKKFLTASDCFINKNNPYFGSIDTIYLADIDIPNSVSPHTTHTLSCSPFGSHHSNPSSTLALCYFSDHIPHEVEKSLKFFPLYVDPKWDTLEKNTLPYQERKLGKPIFKIIENQPHIIGVTRKNGQIASISSSTFFTFSLVIRSELFIKALLLYHGHKSPENDVSAHAIFQKLAAVGEMVSETILAEMYFLGRGTSKDLIKARYLFEGLLDKNEFNAKDYLWQMYYEGLGGEKNHPKARALLKDLSSIGDTKAHCSLGKMYYLGEGGEQNSTLAKELFDKSSTIFCFESIYYLVRIQMDFLLNDILIKLNSLFAYMGRR